MMYKPQKPFIYLSLSLSLSLLVAFLATNVTSIHAKSSPPQESTKSCKPKESHCKPRPKQECCKAKTFTHDVLLDLEDGFWNQFTTTCTPLDPDGFCTGCQGLDLSFEASLQITTIEVPHVGTQIYIQVPVLNFTIPETQNECYINDASFPPPPGGYVYLKDGFLPKKIRPNSVIPLTFTIQSSEYPPLQNPPVSTQGISYQLQIDTEGRIKIGGEGFNPIPVGRHSLLPTNVSYIVPKDCTKVPKNVAVSLTPTTPNLMAGPFNTAGNQLLELQMA